MSIFIEGYNTCDIMCSIIIIVAGIINFIYIYQSYRENNQ